MSAKCNWVSTNRQGRRRAGRDRARARPGPVSSNKSWRPVWSSGFFYPGLALLPLALESAGQRNSGRALRMDETRAVGCLDAGFEAVEDGGIISLLLFCPHGQLRGSDSMPCACTSSPRAVVWACI